MLGHNNDNKLPSSDYNHLLICLYCEIKPHSAADNSNNSSNGDTSWKFGKKHAYVIVFENQSIATKKIKIASTFKMEAKK